MTTAILGLDGGSFELINKWMEKGSLPNIRQLCEEGVSSDMQSCLPPVTCPNWKCYATGKNPGKLGVFWWEKILREENKIVNTSSSHHFDGKEFWRFMDDEVAIVNLPTSYPPEEINGIHVSGGPGSEQSGYTYPEDLEKDLNSKYNYQIHPENMSLLSKDSPDNKCVDEIYELIDERFDLIEDLIQSNDYEFIHLTVFYLNVLQHFYWDHDVVKKAWNMIDSRIGEIMENGSLDHIFIMSDHGSNKIETEFHINTWLEENGYLVTKKGATDALHKLGVTRERVRPILNKLGLEWWARRLVPKRVQNLLPDTEGSVKKSGKEDVIDWGKSKAVASGQGPIYILETDDESRDKIKQQLISDLDGLNDGDNRIIEHAVPARDVYNGKYVNEGPDIVLDQASGIHIDGSIGSSEIFSEPDRWLGENKDTGMFIAHGESINEDSEITDMHILDIAPTVLHLMGYKVPSNMDGEVHKELFKQDSDPKEREVRVDEVKGTKSNEKKKVDGSDVEERLEDLGYMG